LIEKLLSTLIKKGAQRPFFMFNAENFQAYFENGHPRRREAKTRNLDRVWGMRGASRNLRF